MGLGHSPRIVTDGLVLALDAGNVKSNSEIDIRWNNAIAGATKTSSVGVITCIAIHQSGSNFFAQKYSSCEITGSTVWDERPPTISEMDEVLSGNLTCKSHQTGTYSQVQYLFGATPNAGDCCTLRFTGFGVGALIGVGGYFNASERQCRLTGDLRNSPVTITSPTGGFADPIVLTSDPADIKFSSAGSGSDPWYVYWLGPYNQVPYSIRSNPGYVNGATYSSDDGGALVFDGTDDYVDIEASSDFNFGTGDFTVEGWVNTSVYSSDGAYRRVFMLDGPTGNANGNFQILLNAPNGRIYAWSNTGELNYIGSSVIADGSWNHFAACRISNTIYLYVNGVSSGSVSSSVSFTANSGSPRPRIGAYSASSGRLNGKISALKIYKGKGLTASEVQQNYNALKGRYQI